MRSAAALFALVAVFATAACSASDATESASTADGKSSEVSAAGATLTFAKSGAPTLDGTLIEGETLTIRYDQDRISKCKGRSGGRDGWSIGGYASFDGGEAKVFETGETDAKGDRHGKDAKLRLQSAGPLSLWFQANDRFGCHEYDSANGKNYRFDVQPSNKPSSSIDFKADGTFVQQGALVAGSRLTVHYDQDRLDDCRGSSQGRYPGWTITGFASLNGKKATTFETSQDSDKGDATRVDVDATIDLTESGDLALWFQNTSVFGCSAYDSAGGKNFHFNVE